MLLGLRAKSALGSYEITHVAEIFTRVHEEQRPGVIARKCTQTRMELFLLYISFVSPAHRLSAPPFNRRSLPPQTFLLIHNLQVHAELPESFGLVFGGRLSHQFVQAARIFQLDLRASPVEVVQFAEQGHVTVQSRIQASQLLAQLLPQVCTHTHRDVITLRTAVSRSRTV